jgi:hypothetical protein
LGLLYASLALKDFLLYYENMNIFYINPNPIIAAKELADDHIRKMQIESAQMLCTTFWHYGFWAPYKKAHYNHPSTKWVRESITHFNWVLEHGLEICDEFRKRYGKEHATKNVLLWVQEHKPRLDGHIHMTDFTPPPQCMPDEFKGQDTLAAYKSFYINDKVKVKGLNWNKLNNKPIWVK